MLKNNKIRYAVIIAVVAVAGVMYLITVYNSKNPIYDDISGKELYEDEAVSENILPDTYSGEDLEKNIYVYISGCVKTPGVYEVPEGSRVIAVAEAAGGLLEEADDSLINLARVVEDGEHIHIYSVNDQVSEEQKEAVSGMININTATKDMLMKLPGIGESKADGIIAYRDKNGKFTSCEDIMKVSGIKESAYEKIKEMICVE